MRTIIKSRKNTSEGKGQAEYNARPGRKGSAFDSKAQGEYSFLNEVFHSIASVSLPVCEAPFGQAFYDGKVEWTYEDLIKIDALDNISYLENTVKAYCKIHNANFDYKRSDNPLVSMCDLLNLAQSVSPEGHQISLDYKEIINKVVMMEFSTCEYDSYTLFFLPVSFVRNLPSEVKPVVKKALGVISVINCLEVPEEHMDMSYALGVWDDGESYKELEEEDPVAYKELMEMISRYREGDIYDLITECSIYTDNSNLIIDEIEKFLPKYKDTNIGTLLSKLKSGLELAQEGSWKQFAYTPDNCMIEDYNEQDEGTMDQARLFGLVYDLMDEIVERATDCINSEAGAMYIEDFYDCRELTPDTKEAFAPSDFLKRWSSWFSELIDIIQNI